MRLFNLIILFLAYSITQGQKSLPSVTVQDIEGQDINIKEYTKDGKPKIISLWATWCGPCRTELKALNKVYPTWSEKYDVEIVAVTVDRGRMLSRAKSMFETNGWDYTFLHDNQEALMSALGIKGIPYSIYFAHRYKTLPVYPLDNTL